MKAFHRHYIWVCVCFVFMGVLIAFEGMINYPLSLRFHLPLQDFVYTDSGILLVGVCVNFSFLFWQRFLGVGKCLTLAFGLLIVSVAVVTLGAVYRDFPVYLLSMLSSGVAIGLVYPSLNFLLFKLSKDKCHHMKSTALANACWSLGFFLGANAMGLLEKQAGVFAMYGLMLCFMLLMVSASFFIHKYLTYDHGQGYREGLIAQDDADSRCAVFAFVMICLACVCLITGQMFIEYWLPNYLHHMTFNSERVGWIVGGLGLGQFLSRCFFGTVRLRGVSLQGLVLLLIMFCIPFSVLIFHSHLMWLLALGTFAIGLGSGNLLPGFYADAMPLRLRLSLSMRVGVLVLVGTLAGLVNLAINSYIYQKYDMHDTMYMLPLVFLAMFVVYGLKVMRYRDTFLMR